MRKLTLLILGLSYMGGMLFAQSAPQTVLQKQRNEDQTYREGFAKMLIDFAQLDPEYDEATEVDYSNTTISFTIPPEEMDQMKVTYGLNSWMVRPKSSIQFPEIIKNSFAKAVKVKDTATKYAGENILGARIAFPDYPFEMIAEIIPPFRANPDSDVFDGKGILRNVGVVRSAYITVYGLNQPERLYVVTEDVSGHEYEYSFGDLKFIGWKTLEWTNPNYLRDVRSREIESLPLYPQSSSDRRLKAIKIIRSGSIYGGADFVTYVKDVKITFDKAVDDDLINRDIDNEDVWAIVRQRIGIRDSVLYKRNLIKRSLEYLENRKKYNYPEDSAQPTSGAAGGGQAAPAAPAAPAADQQDGQGQ